MADGFLAGIAPDGVARRAFPPGDGGVELQRFGQMIREHLRVRRAGRREAALERGGDPPVDVAPAAPQEGVVGGVAQECVLEEIGAAPFAAFLEDEVGGGQAGEVRR